MPIVDAVKPVARPTQFQEPCATLYRRVLTTVLAPIAMHMQEPPFRSVFILRDASMASGHLELSDSVQQDPVSGHGCCHHQHWRTLNFVPSLVVPIDDTGLVHRHHSHLYLCPDPCPDLCIAGLYPARGPCLS